MNIGIIVFSQTGNTYIVAQKLQDSLASTGYSVNIEKIEPAGEVKQGNQVVEFKTLPDLENYDVLVFGAPVQAFSLARVMKGYLTQIESLNNKNVACFVTKGLPFNWTGGNRAVRQMKNICESRDAKIFETGIVKWVNAKRDKDINDFVQNLSRGLKTLF